MTAAGSYTNADGKIKIKLVTHVYTLVVQQLHNLSEALPRLCHEVFHAGSSRSRLKSGPSWDEPLPWAKAGFERTLRQKCSGFGPQKQPGGRKVPIGLINIHWGFAYQKPQGNKEAGLLGLAEITHPLSLSVYNVKFSY